MPAVRPPPRKAASWRAAPLALVLAAACARDLTVTVRTGDRPPDPDHAPSEKASAGAQAFLVSGIAIDRVQVVLRDIRLQANPTADGAPAVGDASASPPIVLVDLAGAQLSQGAMTEVVPPRGVEWASFYQTVLELRPVAEEDVASDPALAPLLGRTLVVTGRLPGDLPFTYESAVAAVLLREAVFRVGSNHNNLTLNVELNRWFQGAAGEPLDPRDPAAHPTIEANILESIDAYMDDDRDGDPDFLG
jgi:hypothetical protein